MSIKKILIVVVMGYVFLMNAVQVSAAQGSEHILEDDLQEKVLRVLSSVAEENNDALYGIEGINYSAVTLGKRIPSYNIVDGQLKVSEVEIYPVIIDGKMLSQISASWDEEVGWHAQLDNLYVSDEILNFVQDKPFAYIYGDMEPFVCSEGKIYSIYESKLIDEESANEVCKEKDSRIRGSGSSFVEYFHIIEKNLQSMEYHGIEAFVTFNVYDYMEKEGWEEIEEKMMQILASVEPEKENFALEDVDFSSVTVGTSIPEYDVINGQLVEGSTKIFPVFSGNGMVSQFFAWWDGEDWYVQLDSSLVEKTVDLVGDAPFAYIYDNEGVYVHSQGKTALVGLSETVVNERDPISVLSEEDFRMVQYSDTNHVIVLDVIEYLENDITEAVEDGSETEVEEPYQINISGIHVFGMIAVAAVIAGIVYITKKVLHIKR